MEPTGSGFEARSARTSTTGEYDGPAVVTPAADGAFEARSARTSTGGEEGVEVEVTLRGQFEPLDGRFHWYGRIAANGNLDERVRSGSTVTLSTPSGRAEGRLSDVDPWGRFRISGTGRPPF
jgi:hypothetical protein